MLRCSKKKDICESRCLSFWVPPPKGRLHPSALHMLGGSEFRLRQGFAPAAQNACTAQTRRRPEGRFASSPAAAPPFQIEPASLGFDLVLGAALRVSALYISSNPKQGAAAKAAALCFAPGRRRRTFLLLLTVENGLRTCGCGCQGL